jgi:hypothetical protein
MTDAPGERSAESNPTPTDPKQSNQAPKSMQDWLRLGSDLAFLGTIGTTALLGLERLQSPALLFCALVLLMGLWMVAKYKKWIP